MNTIDKLDHPFTFDFKVLINNKDNMYTMPCDIKYMILVQLSLFDLSAYSKTNKLNRMIVKEMHGLDFSSVVPNATFIY